VVLGLLFALLGCQQQQQKQKRQLLLLVQGFPQRLLVPQTPDHVAQAEVSTCAADHQQHPA
jgi:hypothetical protein